MISHLYVAQLLEQSLAHAQQSQIYSEQRQLHWRVNWRRYESELPRVPRSAEDRLGFYNPRYQPRIQSRENSHDFKATT